MKRPFIIFAVVQLAVFAVFAAKPDRFYGWKMDAGGTRLLHSTDGGKSWQDASPPTLVDAAKNLHGHPAPAADAFLADSKNGIPDFAVSITPLAKIFVAMNADDVTIRINIKAVEKGKPETVIYDHTRDGGQTWWKSGEEAPKEDDAPKPVMFGVASGWWQKVTDKETKTLHTADGGKHWVDVSPAALTLAVQHQPEDELEAGFMTELAELDPLDSQRAWLAFQPADRHMTVLEYTADGGLHWRQTTAPVESDDIQICFLDETHGFLLGMGGPGLGAHGKQIYGTGDGGKNWLALGQPQGPSFTATGIAFRNIKEGWITGVYRGEDYYPLYHTVDGGKIWESQKFPVPADYAGGYANTSSPVFIGSKKLHGFLPVHLVRHDPPPDHEADVNYETDNGGLTWRLPASGVKSFGEVPDVP